jgi:putative PEP-CTERM system histidine kinase
LTTTAQIGFVGPVAAALAWGALVALLVGQARLPVGRGPLLAATGVQTLWAALIATASDDQLLTPVPVASAEAVRQLAWSLALLWPLLQLRRVAWPGGAPRFPFVLAATAIGTAGLQLWAAANGFAVLQFGAGAFGAVIVLVSVEQVVRNLCPTDPRPIRLLTLGVAAMFALDAAFFADAVLGGAADRELQAVRGYANALSAGFLAIAAIRASAHAPLVDWIRDIGVSHRIVFHGVTAVIGGLFLLAVALVARQLGQNGSAWAAVLQTLLALVSVLSLALLATSNRLRARLRVLTAKHFFRYRYDYRDEWLRLTNLVARPRGADAANESLAQRALRGLGDLVESRAGALWLRGDHEIWRCVAQNGLSERTSLSSDEALVRFLATTGWIVDVPEWRAHRSRYGGLDLPSWLSLDPLAWLVVPLRLDGDLVGVAQLQQSAVPTALDWEVRDILNTAGSQVAGYLAVQSTMEKLIEAKEFDSFSRMSTFVAHDLKNLVAQLSLLLANARRHSANRDFQRDLLETVENVLNRMRALLLQLRSGNASSTQPTLVSLGPLLRAVVGTKRGGEVEPTLEVAPDLDDATVIGHTDRLGRVIGHVVQNAVEATPPDGSVRVLARRDEDTIVIEIVDTGRGMSRAFVEDKLFKPFVSTKEHGMGIGAFECREYMREIGGALTVRSTEGRGTTVTLRLAAHSPSHELAEY